MLKVSFLLDQPAFGENTLDVAKSIICDRNNFGAYQSLVKESITVEAYQEPLVIDIDTFKEIVEKLPNPRSYYFTYGRQMGVPYTVHYYHQQGLMNIKESEYPDKAVDKITEIQFILSFDDQRVFCWKPKTKIIIDGIN